MSVADDYAEIARERLWLRFTGLIEQGADQAVMPPGISDLDRYLLGEGVTHDELGELYIRRSHEHYRTAEVFAELGQNSLADGRKVRGEICENIALEHRRRAACLKRGVDPDRHAVLFGLMKEIVARHFPPDALPCDYLLTDEELAEIGSSADEIAENYFELGIKHDEHAVFYANRGEAKWAALHREGAAACREVAGAYSCRTASGEGGYRLSERRAQVTESSPPQMLRRTDDQGQGIDEGNRPSLSGDSPAAESPAANR